MTNIISLSVASSIVALPFVRDIPQEADEPKRSFWSVAPTGDYSRDFETGRFYAYQAIGYMQAYRDVPLLTRIVFDMHIDDESRTGIEAGFLSVFRECVR